MFSKVLQKITISGLIFVSFGFYSCSFASKGQKELGDDSAYFIGMRYLAEGKEKEARNNFNKCVKKGTYYCARKSAEALTTFGSVQQKNQACLDLFDAYKDSESLLTCVKQLYSSDEIHTLIELTEACDYKTEYNEILKYRMQALQKRNDSRFDDEVYRWFTERQISDFHYKFYRDFLPHPNFEEDDSIFSPFEFAIDYRIKVYKRDYTYCVKNAYKLLDYFDKQELIPSVQIVSDIGKVCLYGSSEYVKYATEFKKYANQYKGTDMEFYFWFYAGRLYDKAELYYVQSKNCFVKAVECGETEDLRDNALWYLLDTSLNYSNNTIIDSIDVYSKIWSKPEYFDDLLEKLILALLTSGKWNDLYRLYSSIDGYASEEITGKVAYIYARLLEEGYADIPQNADFTKAQLEKMCFERACKYSSQNYYKILAARKLEYDSEQLEQVLCTTHLEDEKELEIDQAAEKLLKGYVYFGFPELIYENYNQLYKNGISVETSLFLAEFLENCAKKGNTKYYPQSLRIVSRAVYNGERNLTKTEIKSLYPQNYLQYVDTYSKKYGINDSVIFALIRSESFFDSKIVSSAGAIGLTQLMEFTGNDIASRLKKSEFSLTDPETNIEFGTYYLANLLQRSGNSYLNAFFAYNAGLTRVRRWQQAPMIGFGIKSKMPEDLFLETLPYTETREYGRKLVSAAFMYNWLYGENDENNLYKIVLDLMNY